MQEICFYFVLSGFVGDLIRGVKLVWFSSFRGVLRFVYFVGLYDTLYRLGIVKSALLFVVI